VGEAKQGRESGSVLLRVVSEELGSVGWEVGAGSESERAVLEHGGG